ncbi:MAG: hypothetical protein NT079_04890 [Candidatus Omnitrophica bacterium]|nr:hypothetical protein [Candidatus Omnitrophota bacterium]
MEILKNSLFDNQKIKKQKLGLKLKLTITTCVAAFIFLAVLISIMYMFGFNELKDKAVEKNKEMARILAASVDSAIENQVELIRVDAKSLFLIDAAKAANLKYGTKNEKEALRYLMDVDKRWLDAPSDHPLLKEYLENQASLALKEKTREKETTASIIATDKFGGLIASTYRPSGFYSFDQDWWKSTSANGEGKPFVGNESMMNFRKHGVCPLRSRSKMNSGLSLGLIKQWSISIYSFRRYVILKLKKPAML